MKTPLSRRLFIKASTLAAGASITLPDLIQSVAANEASIQSKDSVEVQLLDGKPLTLEAGVSFGVPWKQGTVPRSSAFQLRVNGKQLPLQTWPLAYWPDGSLKWSGFATVVPAGLSTPMNLSVGKSEVSGSLKVTN